MRAFLALLERLQAWRISGCCALFAAVVKMGGELSAITGCCLLQALCGVLRKLRMHSLVAALLHSPTICMHGKRARRRGARAARGAGARAARSAVDTL
eukprot:5390153-Amphidinium_carterae.1